MSKTKISQKLDQLSEILNKITEAQIINSDDPDTWDSDTLYDLVESCKAALKILEDKKIKGQFDQFGKPVYENGLCSLVDEFWEKQGGSDDCD